MEESRLKKLRETVKYLQQWSPTAATQLQELIDEHQEFEKRIFVLSQEIDEWRNLAESETAPES